MSPWNRGESYTPEPFVANHDFWRPRKQPKRGWQAVVWGLAIILILCLFYAGVEAVVHKARAHDSKDPLLSDWTMQQHNQNNGNCCNGDDVFVLSDSEWRIKDGHYEALHEGAWLEVPSWALIKKGSDAPTTSALLWVWQHKTQCFRPGFAY